MPLGMSPFELAQLGLGAASGLAGGASAGRQSSANAKDLAKQRVNDARMNRMQFIQGKMDRGRQDARDFVSASGPLGQEQAYVQRNNIARAILPQIGNAKIARPLDPAISALTPQISNLASGIMQGGQLRPDIAQAFSDQATSRALTDRRKALAQINPDFVFQPLTDYMGKTPDEDIFNAEVAQSGQLVRDQRDRGYNDIESILAQMDSDAANDLKSSESKGTPWWKKILGPAAGIAANFIPGVGPLVSTLIGAGVGGASNGVQGAILGGLGGYGGDKLQGLFGDGGGANALAGTNNAMTTASLPLGSGLPGGTGALGGAMSGVNAGGGGNPLLQLVDNPTSWVDGGMGSALPQSVTANPSGARPGGPPQAPRIASGPRPPAGPAPGPRPPQTASTPPLVLPGPPPGVPGVSPGLLGGSGATIGPRSNRQGVIDSIRGFADTVLSPLQNIGMPAYPGMSAPQQPLGRALQTPIGGAMLAGGRPMLSSFGAQVGPAAQRVKFLTERLRAIGGDTTPSGLMAVEQIQDELMKILQSNPSLMKMATGGPR